MKNLRITKIITALIITIWMPSSFADSPYPLKITIKNATTQVNLTYDTYDGIENSVRIEACQNRHNCKVFWTGSVDEVFRIYPTEEVLFRELSENFEKKRLPLTEEQTADLMLVSILASLDNAPSAGLPKPGSRKKLTIPIVTVAELSLQSDYLKNKYDIPTQNNFYNYLSKLKTVKKIAYDITNPTNYTSVSTLLRIIVEIEVEVEVEDKAIKAFIKKLEKVFVAETKRASE